MKGYKQGVITIGFYAKKAKNGTHIKLGNSFANLKEGAMAYDVKSKRNKITIEVFLE